MQDASTGRGPQASRHGNEGLPTTGGWYAAGLVSYPLARQSLQGQGEGRGGDGGHAAGVQVGHAGLLDEALQAAGLTGTGGGATPMMRYEIVCAEPGRATSPRQHQGL